MANIVHEGKAGEGSVRVHIHRKVENTWYEVQVGREEKLVGMCGVQRQRSGGGWLKRPCKWDCGHVPIPPSLSLPFPFRI